MRMHQVYVVRASDNNLTGRAAYRVLDSFEVDVNLSDKYYAGKRVFRTGFRAIASTEGFPGTRKPGCVLFSAWPQQKGVYISLRAALGIKKARRA